MKIGILTSSRADFGIYLPLLKKLRADTDFNLNIIAFGTHLSGFHDNTIEIIRSANFEVKYTVESMLLTDSPNAIGTALGLTTVKFADFWKNHKNEFDLVFCLGDRYEMFAAVVAGIPFQIPFAHIHGGETTLGAIDNIFRHTISLASKYHFVSTAAHAHRVSELTANKNNIYNVGALSLDNVTDIDLLSTNEFHEKWGIDLNAPTILTTFHPETVAMEENESYARELVKVLNNLTNYQILVTMPNTDTAGSIIRKILIDNFNNSKHVFLIENLGPQSYFTAMKYCSFLMGNTSSGIIEAASFDKYVINLGNRQKGRAYGDNIIQVPINAKEIEKAIRLIEKENTYKGLNIYYKSNTADQIVQVLKAIKS
ncbi:MAG: UDP-N-acetylglucosamine 2-epimerase [Pedobacter sp.]|jgi:GDP/UDP-N,N'-diacetylbacillosamine 2-epimerase (hydrolysing)